MTPLKPSFDEFRQLCESGSNLIPVWTELAADYETPVSAFQKLNDGGPCFLLESAENSEQIGRYSFLGTGPRLEIRSHGREISIREGHGSEFVTRPLADELLGISFLIPSAPFPPKARGRRGFGDEILQLPRAERVEHDAHLRRFRIVVERD